MIGPWRGLRDPGVFQHAPQVYARKISDLDSHQASSGVKSCRKAERESCRQALDQNDSDQGKQRSDGENRPCNRSGD
jgi:hypothetical protein